MYHEKKEKTSGIPSPSQQRITLENDRLPSGEISRFVV